MHAIRHTYIHTCYISNDRITRGGGGHRGLGNSFAPACRPI